MVVPLIDLAVEAGIMKDAVNVVEAEFTEKEAYANVSGYFKDRWKDGIEAMLWWFVNNRSKQEQGYSDSKCHRRILQNNPNALLDILCRRLFWN